MRSAVGPHQARGTYLPFLSEIVCTRCGSGDLAQNDGYVDCAACGSAYPLLSGVPVMCRDAVVASAPMISPEAAAAVLVALGLPAEPLNVVRVRAATGNVVRLGDLHIETESQQFLDRLRDSGHAIPGAPQSMAAPVPQPDAASETLLRCRWMQTYIPRWMEAGRERTANVRLANTGPAPIPHAGDNRVTMAYRWRTLAGAELAERDLRTTLPVDIQPGAELTAPIRIRAPAASGRYLLQLILVQEGRRWFEEDAISLPIRVDRAAAPSIPAGWDMRAEPPASYDADHAEAARLLAEWVARHAPDAPRILEVGGNANPMIAGLPGTLFNVDVDLLGLQMGDMVTRHRGQAIHHICADATALPFPPGSFDVIAIFASLHHFPDPARLLAHLRDLLAPGGFVAVLCEPVGHIWPGAVADDFLRELEKGVNEQSFIVDEYVAMFAASRLTAAEAVVDFNSLKARLVPSSALRT